MNEPTTSSVTAPITALDKRRKQLVYRAGHRGIKEMDIILGEFARGRIGTLDEADLDLLEVLMAENDRDLLAWFTGEAALPRRLDTPLFHAVLGFHAEKAR